MAVEWKWARFCRPSFRIGFANPDQYYMVLGSSDPPASKLSQLWSSRVVVEGRGVVNVVPKCRKSIESDIDIFYRVTSRATVFPRLDVQCECADQMVVVVVEFSSRVPISQSLDCIIGKRFESPIHTEAKSARRLDL